LAKLLAERVAVNARQAGLTVQVMIPPAQREAGAAAPVAESAAGLHLFVWHVTSLAPRVELDAILGAMGRNDAGAAEALSADPNQLYERESKTLDDRGVLPLVTMPEYAGLGANVRDWIPARWGEWRLADVWLDLPEGALKAGNSQAERRQAAPAGAKP